MCSRYLRRLAIIAGVCLALLLLIPTDPENAVLLGFSLARLGMLAGFGVILTGLGTAQLLFKRKPALESMLEDRLMLLSGHGTLVGTVQFLTGLALLVGLALFSEFVTTSDDQRKALLLRLMPVVLFIVATAILTLAFRPFRPTRQQAIFIPCATLLLFVVSWLGQSYLLASLVRSYPQSLFLEMFSRAITGFAAYLLAWMLSGTSKRQRYTWALLLVLSIVLFWLQWINYPDKYWRTLRNLAWFAPSLTMGSVLFAGWIFSLWDRLRSDQQPAGMKWLSRILLFALILLSVPYTQAALKHASELNYTAEFVDQKEFLDFAREARLHNFAYTGDHNRTPGYPFLQGLFYQPGMSDAAFFEQGKRVNIALSLVLLVGLWVVYRQFLPGAQSTILALISAFSLFIFKAPYFEAEVLFYFLAFVSFIGMLRLLRHPGARLAAGTGALLGLAHLTKASILPALVLFIAIFSIQEIVLWLTQRGQHKQLASKGGPRFAYLAILLVCYLAVIFPYINAIKARFGSYFYNVNTTFYIWYDSNPEAIQAEQQHHFADAWPAHLPVDELPGPAKYFREHSLGQVLERVRFGVESQLNNLLDPFSVTNYHLSYLALLVLAVLADLKNAWSLLKRYPSQVVFSVLYFLGYLAAFAWYSPISPERRFTYGLYLPFMFSVFVALGALSRQQEATKDRDRDIDIRRFISGGHFVLALTLLINIYLVLTERMFFDRFGS